jgi:hypothetical protein
MTPPRFLALIDRFWAIFALKPSKNSEYALQWKNGSKHAVPAGNHVHGLSVPALRNLLTLPSGSPQWGSGCVLPVVLA